MEGDLADGASEGEREREEGTLDRRRGRLAFLEASAREAPPIGAAHAGGVFAFI